MLAYLFSVDIFWANNPQLVKIFDYSIGIASFGTEKRMAFFDKTEEKQNYFAWFKNSENSKSMRSNLLAGDIHNRLANFLPQGHIL